ncbi:hypothetical protein HanOQP8_Chr06g0228521 [Helianthus annuus]|nr:hypothetical protein HanOQP8_Chr06g0228521 [Helianthus annuus]
MQATHAPNPGPTQEMQSTHAPNPDPTFINLEVITSLERTKTRPRAIQDLVELLSRCVWDNHRIEISSPTMMYPHMVRDIIPYVELLQLFTNDWLDITVIHWFAMYFYESHNSLCAFFNLHQIKGESCTKNSEGVQSHIIDMFTFHTDKRFFVAPYLAK